jgi:tyrosine-protein kinase
MAADPTMPSLDGPRRVLRRRRRLILLCIAAAVAVAVLNVAAQDKKYTATADLLLRDPGIDEKLFEGMGGRAADPNREARTDIVLVSSRDVATRVARRLGRSIDDVEDAVTVTPEGLSNVVHVSAEEKSAQDAARTATLFAREFIARRREVEVARVRDVEARVRERLEAVGPRGSEASALREEIEQLQLLAATQTGDAELVGEAEVPTVATSPKPVRDVFLAAVLGFLLGLGAAFLAERLDRRVRTPEDAADLLGGDLLATPARADADAWQALWARLLHRAGGPPRTIVCTSPGAGDGALDAAWGLAAAAADAGRSAVLVEADLRAPRAAAELGLAAEPGLADCVERSVAAEEALQRAGAVAVLVGGRPAGSPAATLGGPALPELLAALAARHDVVVVAAPAAGERAEALHAIAAGDAVLVAVRRRRTRQDACAALAARLQGVTPERPDVVALPSRRGRGGLARSAAGDGVQARRED